MLKIEHGVLAQALSRAEKIVEIRNTIPILGMVRLEANGDRLEIVTTNLDIEYRQTVPCDGDLPACCIDAKRLSQMASVANKGITMSLDGNTLTVKSGRSRWAAPSMTADDFPIMPAQTLPEAMAIAGEELADIIERTVWAASTEAARYYLQGVFFNAGTFVATNSQVLAMIETDMGFAGPDAIIPTALLRAIQASADGLCELSWDEKRLRFVCGDVTITGKTIDGSFPDYRRVIPAPCEAWAVDADELAGAVKRVRIASDAKERKLRIRKGDNAIHVRIEGTAGFEAEEEVPADCAEGYEFGVNADYLAQVLTALDTDSVTVEQADAGAPIAFRPASQKPGRKFLGIVMPLRM